LDVLGESNRLELIRNDLTFDRLVEQLSIEEVFFEDRWHPRELGYEVIARDVLERIEQMPLAWGN